MSCLAVAPSNPSVAYSGTFFGQAFRSEDGGATWARTESFGTTYVSSLAVDPVDPLTVYVASGNGTFKSTDGGDHWTLVLSFGPLVAVDPSNRDRIYASVRAGGPTDQLFRSDDGGEHWTEITGTLDDSGGIGFFALVFETDGTVLAATSNGVFRSTDQGTTWVPRSDGLTSLYVQALTIDPTNDAVLYAGTDTAGAFKSTDHGFSWTPANAGLPSANVLHLLAAPGLVLASVAPYAVYQSTDGGATWTPTGSGFPDPVLANAFAAGSGTLLTATSKGIFLSSDAGATWDESNEGLSANPGFSVAPSRNGSTVFAGTAAGFFDSVDGARSWLAPANEGLGNIPTNGVGSVAVDPTDDATLYAAATTCCGIYKTTDGGDHWSLTGLSGIFLNDLAVDTQTPSTVYGLHGLVGVYKTVDAGDVWNLMNSGIPAGVSFTALGMDPQAPATLYVATQPGGGAAADATPQVYLSVDGAESWNPTEGLEGAFVYEFTAAPSHSATVYAASGSVYASQDSGAHWASTSSPGSSGTYSVAVDPSDPARIYAGTIGEGVFRSTDGGATFHPMSAGLAGLSAFVYVVRTDATGSILYAGTPSGVFEYRLAFDDVPADDPFHDAISVIAINGITSGCGSGDYCPDDPLTRAQSSVFLLRSIHGGDYAPPAATGTVFVDVPADGFAAAWIEELAAEGITSGCGGGSFCPDAAVTRAEMAVFLLRAKHGPTYEPPPATGTVFADVPAEAFAAAWIEELALEGITSGCGGGSFCPGEPTTRAQIAALLVRTFDFP
ncbi:MAG TPA: S-layer homology domain-containing protein [Thermoanaerobaculia bacterium]